jgi:hypothetical protein
LCRFVDPPWRARPYDLEGDQLQEDISFIDDDVRAVAGHPQKRCPRHARLAGRNEHALKFRLNPVPGKKSLAGSTLAEVIGGPTVSRMNALKTGGTNASVFLPLREPKPTMVLPSALTLTARESHNHPLSAGSTPWASNTSHSRSIAAARPAE